MKPNSHIVLLAAAGFLFASQGRAEAPDGGPLQTEQLVASGSSAESASAELDPLDWPNWRGPEQNGISRETGLADSWSLKGENVLWKRPELATRSTPIVMRGKLYAHCRHEPGTPREAEKVVCADAATGEILWENVTNVFLSDVPKERVGWSNLVGDPSTGRVYALSVCGSFQCLDGDSGEEIWSRSLSEEFGLLSTYGGRTNTPVVFEDLVLISAVVIGWGEMSVPAHRFIAFEKQTGEPVWFNGTSLRPDDTTYSTPVLAVLDGQAAMVFGSGDGAVWALQPRTGRPLWHFQFSQRGLNVTPVVEGNTVYMGQSEENPNDNTMGAFAAINGVGEGDVTKSGRRWNKRLMVGKSSPLVVDGRVYAVDDSNTMYVLEADTGKQIQRQRLTGTITRASPLYADGRIYACTTSAWHVLELDEGGVKIAHRLRFRQGEEVHGSPIASHGRIYLPTTQNIYCLGSESAQTGAAQRPQPPQEEAAGERPQAAQVQVVPVESLIAPGESVDFKVRLYNGRGQLIGEADEVRFSASGGGQISSDGVFTTAGESGHAGCVITAQVGELKGTARVRIAPPLPWKFDFGGGEVPITWVGARYRHITLDFDLLEKLQKRDPRAAQLYIYLTTSFVNGNTDSVRYNDRTSRRTWTELLRYLSLDTTVATLEDARRELEPALKILEAAKILANWELTAKGGRDVELSVQRGSPGPAANPVMVKISTIPKGTRSQAWMGPSELDDYTIQADVQGAIKGGQTPDIGLIAQRYTLDLMGNSQQLQIRSWTPELHRFSKTVPFEWKPGLWYTMKFRAAAEEGKAVLRGKVWPRGEPEPEEWTIEATDAAPNLIGSPGLFGNASNAEVFLDNVQVTPN